MDVDVSYTFAERFTLTIGSQNLLDTHPEKLSELSATVYPVTGGTSDGQVYPSSGGPFGLNGGFWYGRRRIKY